MKYFMTLVAMLLLNISNINKATAAEYTEVHVDLCHSDEQDLLSKLDLSFEKRVFRNIAYFDTKNLNLFNSNLILRIRSSAEEHSLTVKIRNLKREQVDSKWLNSSDFKCESDLYFNKNTSSCSLSLNLTSTMIDDVFIGKTSIGSALPSSAVELIHDYIDLSFPIDQAQIAGPSSTYYWSWINSEFSKKLSLEIWTLGEKKIQEISTRVPVELADSGYKKLAAFLSEKGIAICDTDQQESKTKEALLYYLIK
jgi:hypothetical protein